MEKSEQQTAALAQQFAAGKFKAIKQSACGRDSTCLRCTGNGADVLVAANMCINTARAGVTMVQNCSEDGSAISQFIFDGTECDPTKYLGQNVYNLRPAGAMSLPQGGGTCGDGMRKMCSHAITGVNNTKKNCAVCGFGNFAKLEASPYSCSAPDVESICDKMLFTAQMKKYRKRHNFTWSIPAFTPKGNSPPNLAFANPAYCVQVASRTPTEKWARACCLVPST